MRIRDEQPKSYFRELRNNFWLKYLNSLIRIWVRNGKNSDPGWNKIVNQNIAIFLLQNIFSGPLPTMRPPQRPTTAPSRPTYPSSLSPGSPIFRYTEFVIPILLNLNRTDHLILCPGGVYNVLYIAPSRPTYPSSLSPGSPILRYTRIRYSDTFEINRTDHLILCTGGAYNGLYMAPSPPFITLAR